MIKSVVQAIPTYVMSCFLLPLQFCNKLNSYTRKFWWAGDPKDSKIHWLKGEDLCKPKWQGGMGFRDHRDFNLALLAKQAWRIITNPNAFWVRMLKGIYFPRTNFLNATRGARPSWVWSSLCQGRELLQKGLRWQIKSGKEVKFWTDKWVPSLHNFQIQSSTRTTDEQALVASFIHPISKEWDVQKLRHCVSGQEIKAITAIPLSKLDEPDKMIWHFSKNGSYSVKSGYHFARSSGHNSSI